VKSAPISNIRYLCRQANPRLHHWSQSATKLFPLVPCPLAWQRAVKLALWPQTKGDQARHTPVTVLDHPSTQYCKKSPRLWLIITMLDPYHSVYEAPFSPLVVHGASVLRKCGCPIVMDGQCFSLQWEFGIVVIWVSSSLNSQSLNGRRWNFIPCFLLVTGMSATPRLSTLLSLHKAALLSRQSSCGRQERVENRSVETNVSFSQRGYRRSRAIGQKLKSMKRETSVKRECTSYYQSTPRLNPQSRIAKNVEKVSQAA
jgi:hypothetical protein